MSRNQIIEAERRLLAALCQDSLSPTARAQIHQQLARHRFQLPENQIILQAISELPASTPEGMRKTLQAKLTRMGFPDTDTDALFHSEPIAENDLVALLGVLLTELGELPKAP